MTQGSSFLATLGWMIAILSGLPAWKQSRFVVCMNGGGQFNIPHADA